LWRVASSWKNWQKTRSMGKVMDCWGRGLLFRSLGRKVGSRIFGKTNREGGGGRIVVEQRVGIASQKKEPVSR